jgi:hypothetical protein
MNSLIRTVHEKEEQFTAVLLILYYLSLPLFPLGSAIIMILFFLYWIVLKRYRQSWQVLKNSLVLLLPPVFFMLHVSGLLYSSNLAYGIADIQTKLSFLIVPVVFSGLILYDSVIRRIKNTWIVSTVLSLIILSVFSLRDYLADGNIKDFMYSQLSHFRHPTYLSIYFNIAMLFIQEKIFREHKTGSKVKNVLGWSLLFVFLYSGILFLSARTATFTAILTVLVYPFLIRGKPFLKNNSKWIHFSHILLMVFLFFSYIHTFNRYNQVQEEIVTRENLPLVDSAVYEPPNSTNIRINTWKYSFDIIRKNLLFGVGTGDLKDELVRTYTENNYQYGISKKPSPHNQFLHTSVILGICGLSVLSLMLLCPLWISFRRKEWLYFLFLVVIILNCLTESVLEREAGILFFVITHVTFYLFLFLQRR